MKKEDRTSGYPAFMSTWYWQIATGLLGLGYFGPMVISDQRSSSPSLVALIVGGLLIFFALVSLVSGLVVLFRRMR